MENDKIMGNFKDGKYNGIPWSKISDYKTYISCQKDIKNILGKENPFMWELENWPFENSVKPNGLVFNFDNGGHMDV